MKSPARPGKAWRGLALLGKVRQGPAWRGKAARGSSAQKEARTVKTYTITIKGTTALLQHRFAEQNEVEKKTRRVEIKTEDPRDVAERAAYRLPDGQLYIPGAAISRLLREAGGGHKQRGSRKSLKYVVPSATLVLDDAIPLFSAEGEAATTFEVDSRPVVIPATKGRIMRHRPRLNSWSATFTLRINDDLINPDTVQQLLTEGGQQLGVGDFRPEKGGPFGCFNVTLFIENASREAEAA